MSKNRQMDKKVVRRMIKRIASVPTSYDQRAYFVESDDVAPCGTVACLAGEAVICSARTVKAGIKLAFETYASIPEDAGKLLGLPDGHGVFAVDGCGWPEPYRSEFRKAGNRREVKARVVVAYLKEALKRGTMIWKTENTNGN